MQKNERSFRQKLKKMTNAIVTKIKKENRAHLYQPLSHLLLPKLFCLKMRQNYLCGIKWNYSELLFIVLFYIVK